MQGSLDIQMMSIGAGAERPERQWRIVKAKAVSLRLNMKSCCLKLHYCSNMLGARVSNYVHSRQDFLRLRVNTLS